MNNKKIIQQLKDLLASDELKQTLQELAELAQNLDDT